MSAFIFNFAGPDMVIILLMFWLFLPFVIWMIVDCVKYETDAGNMKLIWVLIILFLPLGSLVYLFARKLGHKRTQPVGPPPSLPRV